MDRREFLKSTSAAAAATAVAATGAAAAETPPSAPAAIRGLQELRLAVSFDDGYAGPADWAHRLSRTIADMSNGRFRISPVFGIADGEAAIRNGAADLCFDKVDNLVDTHRGFAYFAGLPGHHGLQPRQLQSWVSVGGGAALWDDLGYDIGIKPLLAAHTGPRNPMLSTRPINEIAQLAGVKVHAGGLSRDVARGLGMDPVAVTSGTIAAAMQRGDIEIAECGGAITSYALGLLAAAPYSAGTSLNQNGTALYLGVNRALWDSLDASDQAMLSLAAGNEFQLSLAEEEAHRHLLYPAPAPEHVWPIASDLAHAIERVAAAVVAHTAGTDARSRRIADSLTAFKVSIGADAYA